ncbi:conserved hypothetical protein [Leptospira interrogans serovar Copenhageni str. Fiocruz L1-130]|uniref:Uncharacterized protein n=1 Tax=Leptospira interrogans serogroup Icterohaemorrhagiae serovar copenhageni (strain Fiocruz L1-130) TaxID=267671 RepID=Q72TR6_LEPIC|nr:conserved hypothetical protein [Leptospira interrogans serovar Copenhageni str. Fiocruz L1-130]
MCVRLSFLFSFSFKSFQTLDDPSVRSSLDANIYAPDRFRISKTKKYFKCQYDLYRKLRSLPTFTFDYALF